MSSPPAPEPSAEELKRRFVILQRCAILFTVPDNLLRSLARQLHPVSGPAGTVFVKQGDPGDSLYIVEDGKCEVSIQASPGHSITIAFLGPADFFGEMSLISDNPRSASIRALTDCNLLVLDRRTLFQTISPESDAFLDLQRLVEQRRSAMGKLVQRATVPVPETTAVTVSIYSPKGGSGRTTLAVNLAAALARDHPNEVVLVDLALPFNHAALISNLVPTGSLALAAQDPANFEERMLTAILHHPSGMLLLPSVLRPEEADLITPDLVNRALDELVNSYRFVIIDLPVAMTENVLTVLDSSQKIVVIATPELSTLKDVTDLLRLFSNVLHIVPGRVLLTMNNKTDHPVVKRADMEKLTDNQIACEIGYDGTRQDVAAVKGEILALTDPKSEIAKGASRLAELIGPKVASKGLFAKLAGRS